MAKSATTAVKVAITATVVGEQFVRIDFRSAGQPAGSESERETAGSEPDKGAVEP